MALIAYWGMTVTSLNRNSFMPSSSQMGKLLPSRVTLPATYFILPSRRIRLFPRVDLPQPDSPARPMISLSAIEKVAPSRALTSPANVR
jgi:hypothetical protein